MVWRPVLPACVAAASSAIAVAAAVGSRNPGEGRRPRMLVLLVVAGLLLVWGALAASFAGSP